MATTAHDLAADWAWLQAGARFRVKGGRVLWEEAEYLLDGKYADHKVRIGRIVDNGRGLRAIVRWIDPNTPVELIPQGSGGVDK